MEKPYRDVRYVSLYNVYVCSKAGVGWLRFVGIEKEGTAMSFKNPDKLKKKKPVYKKPTPKATPKNYDDAKEGWDKKPKTKK